MKRFILILVLTFAVNTAFAANAPAPMNHIPKTLTDKVHLRINHQMAQIRKEAKLGKLTKAQEKILIGQVEAIRKQELAFLKSDNSKQLTDAQEIQINSQLDALSQTIPMK